MRLRHMNDRHCDLPTQIDALSRETTEMFLATLGSIGSIPIQSCSGSRGKTLR